MVHIWVINEHASSHSRLKSFVQKGLELPALLYITEDAERRGVQVQQIEQTALNQIVQNELGKSLADVLRDHMALSLPKTAASPSVPAAAGTPDLAGNNGSPNADDSNDKDRPGPESGSAWSAAHFSSQPSQPAQPNWEAATHHGVARADDSPTEPQVPVTSASPAASGTLHEELSARELQTLMLLGQGLSVSGIARNLALSVKTISTYRARALEKLKLNTTADLIRYAVEHLMLPNAHESDLNRLAN